MYIQFMSCVQGAVTLLVAMLKFLMRFLATYLKLFLKNKKQKIYLEVKKQGLESVKNLSWDYLSN